MSLLADERMPKFVAIVTTGAGTALALAPGLGRAAGLGDDPRVARAAGIADLALVPGLWAGRPRWPWMAARAVLNVAFAAQLARVARAGGDDATVAKAGAATLLGLTVVDGACAAALRAEGR